MESTQQVPRLACGCIDNTHVEGGVSSSLFGQTCREHTRPRFIDAGMAQRRDLAYTMWYRENTCPCCGRMNRTGLACPEKYTVTCTECGLHTCHRLDMGHYCLEKQMGLICPSTTHKPGCKPRTNSEKSQAALIAADPARNAALCSFQGKRQSIATEIHNE